MQLKLGSSKSPCTPQSRSRTNYTSVFVMVLLILLIISIDAKKPAGTEFPGRVLHFKSAQHN
jgi:hypothetical protein